LCFSFTSVRINAVIFEIIKAANVLPRASFLPHKGAHNFRATKIVTEM